MSKQVAQSEFGNFYQKSYHLGLYALFRWGEKIKEKKIERKKMKRRENKGKNVFFSHCFDGWKSMTKENVIV